MGVCDTYIYIYLSLSLSVSLSLSLSLSLVSLSERERERASLSLLICFSLSALVTSALSLDQVRSCIVCLPCIFWVARVLGSSQKPCNRSFSWPSRQTTSARSLATRLRKLKPQKVSQRPALKMVTRC